MRIALGLVALASHTALAEPVAIDPRARPDEPVVREGAVAAPEQPLTAADVHGAPLPGDEHGRLDPLEPRDGAARKLGRTLLWIPRLPLEAVIQPVRGFLYLQDRYDVVETVSSQFRTSDRSITIYPTAMFETGFGANVGARAKFVDLFGGGEAISARVAIGDELERVFELGIGHGRGRVNGSLSLDYKYSDEEHFFGYGNGDLVKPEMPLDPLATDSSVESELMIEQMRASTRLRFELGHDLALTATARVGQKEFGLGDEDEDADGEGALATGFQTDRIPGFMTGTTYLYNELEFAWDTRRRAHRWDAPGMRGTGGLALVYAGRQEGMRTGETDFYRAGFDLQRYVRLAIGPRVLELRMLGEVIAGARDEVPFSELPRLGGSALLRGYPADRFRDRVAVVGQASYLWAVSSWLAPSVFVDVGRVYSGLDELSFEKPRVGFGGAVELYSKRALTIRAQLASSLDGGLYAYLMLSPVFDIRTRSSR